jgi:hypothetical protein
MALTRSQLDEELRALDAELRKLEADGVQEEVIQMALERAVNVSTRTVGQRDRLWWWTQLYAVLDHRAVRLLSSSGVSSPP